MKKKKKKTNKIINCSSFYHFCFSYFCSRSKTNKHGLVHIPVNCKAVYTMPFWHHLSVYVEELLAFLNIETSCQNHSLFAGLAKGVKYLCFSGVYWWNCSVLKNNMINFTMATYQTTTNVILKCFTNTCFLSWRTFCRTTDLGINMWKFFLSIDSKKSETKLMLQLTLLFLIPFYCGGPRN